MPKDFLPTSAVSQRNSPAAAARRERFYQAVIWLLVIWNLCLQARSLSRDATSSLHGMSTTAIDAAEFHEATQQLDAEAAMPPSLTGSFSEPALTIESFGSAGIVCSGCTDDGGNASAPALSSNASAPNVAANLSSSAGGATATAAVGDGSSSSSTTTTIAGGGDSTADAPAAGASSVPTAPSPLETASLAAGDAAAAKLALGGPLPKTGRRAHDPPFVPSPPIPAGLIEGTSCSSVFKGDATTAQCNTFCIGKFARAHCARCKCRSCSFCPLNHAISNGTAPAAAAATAGVASAVGAAAGAAAGDVASPSVSGTNQSVTNALESVGAFGASAISVSAVLPPAATGAP